MSSNKTSFTRFFLTYAALIVGAVVIYQLVIHIKEWWKPAAQTIKTNYENNLCLVTHDYAYAVNYEMNGENILIYVVKDEKNQFVPWEADTAVQTGNRIYAAGIILDSSGTCITSKFASRPWENETDIKALKSLFSEELNISEQHVTVNGLSIRITMKPVKQIGNGGAVEIVAKTMRDPDNSNNYNTAYLAPAQRKGKLPFTSIDFGIPDNKKCYLLDFSDQDFNYNLPVPVRIARLKPEDFNSSNGFTIKEKDAPFFEGAPVFNDKKQLVGVHTKFNLTYQSAPAVQNFIARVPYRTGENVMHFAVKFDTVTIPVIDFK